MRTVHAVLPRGGARHHDGGNGFHPNTISFPLIDGARIVGVDDGRIDGHETGDVAELVAVLVTRSNNQDAFEQPFLVFRKT